MELYFTEEEMIRFLEKKEYIVEEVDIVIYRPTHHNHIKWDIRYIKIAYPARPSHIGNDQRPNDLIEKKSEYGLSKYSVEKQFQEELKRALLKL